MKILLYWLKLFFRGKVVDYYGTWFGRSVHLRIEPKGYEEALRQLHNLIDDGKFVEAKLALKTMDRFYLHASAASTDPELIRAETYMSFQEEPFAEEQQ